MKRLLVISLLFFSLPLGAANPDEFLAFQIIQDQITFDNSNVKMAELNMNPMGEFNGLVVELKPAAAADFNHMTKNGLTKSANVILNKKIVSVATIHSPLGPKILITGITKEEAQRFLISLRLNEKNN